MNMRVIYYFQLLLFLNACIITEPYKDEPLYLAKVVDFDLNCATCIVEFPNDSTFLKQQYGESILNRYSAINLRSSDYLINQQLLVNVSAAPESEMNACLTLYPTPNYNRIYITQCQIINPFYLNRPFEIGLKQCHVNIDEKITICLDSLIADSRCPANANCIWAGNATVRLSFSHENSNHIFDLNTNLQFLNDTIIDGFNIKLLNVMPYPGTEPEPNKQNISCLVEIKRAND